MPKSFLVNFLTISDSIRNELYPFIVPEICQILSSSNPCGGEVLYLIISRWYMDFFKYIIQVLGGLSQIHRTHWDYILKRKYFSNKCVITGEKIDDFQGFLYASDQKKHVNYISYTGIQALFSRREIKCPITDTPLNFYIPLSVLKDEMHFLLDLASHPLSQEVDCTISIAAVGLTNHYVEEETAAPVSLKSGFHQFSKEFLKSLRKYKLYSTIPKYAYSYNEVLLNRPHAIFVNLCFSNKSVEFLCNCARKSEDRLLIRQLLLKHNSDDEPDETLFTYIFGQEKASLFFTLMSSDRDGQLWLQNMLEQSSNETEKIKLKSFISQKDKSNLTDDECRQHSPQAKRVRISEAAFFSCGKNSEAQQSGSFISKK